MKQDYLHICVVLDASGSMECIKKDTQGSFNSFLEEQKKAEGKTVFDLFQFNDEVARPIKSANLSTVDSDLMEHYYCSGCTALHDAICTAIDTLGQEFAAMPEEERPSGVLVAILTDGYENASRHFHAEDVKQRIEHQTNVYSWQFVFLAANQDACVAGESLGVQRDACVSWEQSVEGLQRVRYCMADRAYAMRTRRRRELEQDENDN